MERSTRRERKCVRDLPAAAPGRWQWGARTGPVADAAPPPRPPSVTKVPALHPGAGLPAAQVQGIPGERPSRKMNGWPQAAELVTIELTRTLPVWLSDRIYGKMNDELQSTDLKRDLRKPVC